MRVIFLDVDGVLNSRPQINFDKKFRKDDSDKRYKLSDIYVKNLSRLYHRYTNTVIVLSSAWKNQDKEKEMLKTKLAEYGMKIYDETPDVCSETGELCTSRIEEIHEYLLKNKRVEQWVSLDDDNDQEAYEEIGSRFGLHLCETQYGNDNDQINDCGFNSMRLHVALEILGGRLN